MASITGLSKPAAKEVRRQVASRTRLLQEVADQTNTWAKQEAARANAAERAKKELEQSREHWKQRALIAEARHRPEDRRDKIAKEFATRHSDHANDLLYGLSAIAGFLGITVPQTKQRARAKQIPTFKVGRIVCATRSGLTEWFAKQEGRTNG